MIQTIDAALFVSMMKSGAALLDKNKQQINDLNVFPVPDGDTGSNMTYTMNAGAAELEKNGFGTVSAAADKFASALLRGARGNSGVILSLLFRGFSKALKGCETADTYAFAKALKEGVSTAYNAVMRPTEGTILTVARLAADAAMEYAETGDDFEEMFARLTEAGEAALERTVDQNPVLKKAGVVDAGGKGYLCIVSGAFSALKGDPVIGSVSDGLGGENSVFGVFSTDDITFAFDTVFIVRKTGERSIEPLRIYLSSIGDSLVIGEDDESFKVHVHTNVPGDALNEAQKYGTLELAKIENMRTQHDDLAAGKHVQCVDDLTDDMPCAAPAEKKYGFVSVCAGEGLHEMFRELGVDAVVDGGQTMNPSTDDILKAVNSVPAKTVFVFPNNSNIIMAAEQCVPLTDKNVIVVRSKTVPQGITALYSFDESMEAEELAGVFADACGAVHTVLITNAVRDSEYDGIAIKEGEYIALLDGVIAANNSDLDELIAKVLSATEGFSRDMINVFYGDGCTEEDAAHVAALIESAVPAAEVTALSGGQPVYLYMISIE